MTRALTLADGQLDSTAATVVAGAVVPTSRISATFVNVGSSVETVVLTFQRAGGTARRIARAELDADESLIISGLPIQPDDTLLGVSTNADTVDYLVVGQGEGSLSITVLAADGSVKQQDTAEAADLTTVDGEDVQSVQDTASRRLLEEILVAVQELKTCP